MFSGLKLFFPIPISLFLIYLNHFPCSPRSSLKLLQKLAASKKRRDAAREAEKQQREEAEEEAANAAERESSPMDIATTGNALEEIAALQQKLGLSLLEGEVLEGEQVIFPASPEEQSLALDSDFVNNATQALKDLGIYDAALNSMFDEQEASVIAFQNAVLLGFVAATAIKTGECSDATAASLFSIMATTKNMELAGAASRTLLCMLGEEIAQDTARLDPGHAFTDPAGHRDITVNPEALPSAATILEALKINGYSSSSGEDTNEEINTDPSQFKPVEGLRIQTIKQLLHTAAAVCHHCATHPDSDMPALDPGSVSALILAVVHMGLDPTSLQLQRDLDAACTALLGALSKSEWTKQLPILADKIAALGPSTRSRLRILRQLPANEPTGRGRQLQRFVGCIVVEKILGGKLAPTKSTIPKRCMGMPDPEAVLQGQPWFTNPKGVVAGATNSAAAVAANPLKTHTFFDIELLLHICDVLVWPAAMRAMQDRQGNYDGPSQGFSPGIDVLQAGGDDPTVGDDGPLSYEFLSGWCNFLSGLDRYIKTLQPDEMAVKTLANRFSFRYKEAVQRRTWGSP